MKTEKSKKKVSVSCSFIAEGFEFEMNEDFTEEDLLKKFLDYAEKSEVYFDVVIDSVDED
jgi:hypothetical protein